MYELQSETWKDFQLSLWFDASISVQLSSNLNDQVGVTRPRNCSEGVFGTHFLKGTEQKFESCTSWKTPITVNPRFSPRGLIVNFEIWHGGLFEGGLFEGGGLLKRFVLYMEPYSKPRDFCLFYLF